MKAFALGAEWRELLRPGDFATIKSAMKDAVSTFLYKKTKRSPMVLPVIMEV